MPGMRILLALAAIVVLVSGCPSEKKKADSGVCEPGATMACYDHPDGAAGVGICAAGVSTCGADQGWGACAGSVGPAAEICANALDDDCNGTPDDGPPDLSRIEFTSNTIDDNCNGMTNEAATLCDSGLTSNATEPLDYAKAVEMCAVTTTDATNAFGVTAAGFTLTDGTGAPNASQRSIRPAFGTNVAPRAGSSLTVLSTGVAASVGQTNPAFAVPQNGTDFVATSTMPASWITANTNVVPVAPGCPALSGVPATNDPILFTLQLKAPTNAHAIAFDAFFFTADFPEYVCSSLTDVFVALLESSFAGAPANPADGNIARATGVPVVSASNAFGSTGLFTACTNGATGCSSGVAGTISTCAESASLTGTGYEVVDAVCQAGDLTGGGTGWLTASGNVVPGETITLRFALWDTADGISDSTVLVDNVRRQPANVTPGAQIAE